MATALTMVPRSPLFNSKSGTADSPDNYRQNMLRLRNALREEAMTVYRLNREYGEIQTYIDFLEGRHWDPKRPRYRSHFFDNRLAQSRTDIISVLTDIRPTIDVTSTVSGFEQQAEIARRVIQHEWIRNDLDIELGKVIDHALFSVGYWKIGALMPGVMVVYPCGIDTVLPIQPGVNFQDSVGVLYRTYKPLQYFKNIWGNLADGLERYSTGGLYSNQARSEYGRPERFTEYSWNSLSPQMRYHLGLRGVKKPQQEASAFPSIELEEFWINDWSINDSLQTVVVKDPNLGLNDHNYWYEVKPGERLFPRKRLIVFVGDRVMYDGPSPYWHGMYPFAELILNPITWGPGGLSVYRNLLPLNRSINRIGAGVEDVINRAIRPQILTKTGSVYDQSWEQFIPDMPGGRLKLTQIGNPQTDVRYMDPPALPAYVHQFLGSYLIPTFDRLSGTLDVTGLQRKNQVPGGETIEQMRDSMQTAFRLWGRQIEVFLRRSGIQAVSNIFQYYTRQQRMRILGADGQTRQDYDYDPDTMVPWSVPREDHWRNFSMEIAEGSLHSGSQDRRTQVWISLFRLGAISRQELLRQLKVGNADQIVREIMEEHGGDLAPDAIGKGQVPRLTRSARTGNPY